MTPLRVGFDPRFPHARWGPLFHVFRLERRDVVIEWRQAAGFPEEGRSVLEDADVGLFIEPPQETGLSAVSLDTSPMAVLMAAGHRLAAQWDELAVADILDEVFLGGSTLNPEWPAFWTLDELRGAPPRRSDDDVRNAEQALDVVAAGRALATVPLWAANGLPHPGVIALPLRDGPAVSTSLVWRSDDETPAVRSLVELARAWTADPAGDLPSRELKSPRPRRQRWRGLLPHLSEVRLTAAARSSAAARGSAWPTR